MVWDGVVITMSNVSMFRLVLVVTGLLLAGGSCLTATITDDAYAAHRKKLEKRVPAGFHIVEQRPFFVVGDESASMVKRRARGTVKWAVDHLKKAYFKRDPDEIIDIWLFKDKVSYRKHTLKLFGDRPTTPYGYYSPSQNALIMNIATGGGTLVHEIVHPFMAANFPKCPPWFNEGLGSLYEQSHERNGRIVGLTNWRLPVLKQAIRNKTTIPFKDLCALDDEAFYRQDSNAHYPQSRYLCYYLQERGLLIRFYREFTASAREDPTGYKTLKALLKEDDMEAFRRRWEDYVMRLRFR